MTQWASCMEISPKSHLIAVGTTGIAISQKEKLKTDKTVLSSVNKSTSAQHLKLYLKSHKQSLLCYMQCRIMFLKHSDFFR